MYQSTGLPVVDTSRNSIFEEIVKQGISSVFLP